MKTNVPYVVIEGNATFMVGDHIKKLEDGAILCREAGGWICCEDVPEATKDMKVSLDKAELMASQVRLENKLFLNTMNLIGAL